MNFSYQIALIGDVAPHEARLRNSIESQIHDLGINRSHISIVLERDIASINQKGPIVAVFFAYTGVDEKHNDCLQALLNNSITIIPCVSDIEHVSAKIPKIISHVNAFVLGGDDKEFVRLTTLILENLRLLRIERRVFISYKRTDSQFIAAQLYDKLNISGFDVFLDTRSVPYGADFQSILWHRMADSDVVILLDTPNFRNSAWTMQELARANSTNIQILHVLWPGVKIDSSSAFSEFLSISASDFRSRAKTGEKARLKDETMLSIVAKAESIRARALAARHRSLVDNFCDQAKEQSVMAVSVQPERYISLEYEDGTQVSVVPTIGVPRADRYQEMAKLIQAIGRTSDSVWLLYDERGILETWLEHLEWLNAHLPVLSVQVSKCALQIQGAAK